MENRPNVWGPALLVVVAFVVAFLLTYLSPLGGFGMLGLAGALRMSPEQLADFERRLREATRDLGFCNAARSLGMDCADLSRVLKNEGSRALDARRIDLLPIEERRRWYWAGVERFGLPIQAKRYLKMALVMVGDEDEVVA